MKTETLSNNNIFKSALHNLQKNCCFIKMTVNTIFILLQWKKNREYRNMDAIGSKVSCFNND